MPLMLVWCTAYAQRANKRLYDGGTVVPFGFDGGMTYDGNSFGLITGLELSLVKLTPQIAWAGVVTAAHYDHGRETGAFSLGIEGGLTVAGLEASYTVHTDSAHGPRLRAVFPFVFGGSFLGVEHLSDGGFRGLVGAFLKWPFGLDD